MPAPGTLFGEATQALEGASQTADSANQLKEKSREASMASGDEAGKNLSAQQITELHGKLDQQANMMTITPQIALGLMRNTGDKEWLQAVGKPMRSDVVLGLYQYGINRQMAGRAPKPVKRYIGGKEQTGIAWQDENGINQEWFGEGIAPEKIHPARSVGAKDESSKTRKDRMKAFEDDQKLMADPFKWGELQKKNPKLASEVQDRHEQGADQYALDSKAGSGGPAATGDNPSSPNSSAPVLDKDALFNNL